MNTITAYATDVEYSRQCATEFSVIEPQRNIKLAHVSVIRGFLHFVGQRGTHFAGIEAVIRPTGSNYGEDLTRALAAGIKGGRDDRR